ncbi:hypothetical protein FJZ31_03385 [Candidatus Poribacteria bacterium]|nr:hypothetical protein [Candidatus Poribacteria bacterium]
MLMFITITGLDFRNYLDRLYQEQSRHMRFRGATPDAFKSWEQEARAKVIDLLSIDHLTPMPLNMQILSEEDAGSYTVQKIAYQTLPEVCVPAYLLTPKSSSGPMPAVLCPHGHGYGKEQVMNEDGAYHQYPRRFAEVGFVTLVPDHISFGERANQKHPGCSFEHEALNLLGSTVIGYRMWDLQRALDLLESLPQVDNERIGCGGLSLGGEMTLYLAACDTRIKVTCISCFLTSFAGTFLKVPHCTCGYVPKMARYFEHADIATLIAPRPLLIQAGTQDASFLVSDTETAYKELQTLYETLGCKEQVSLDVFEGGHEFHLETALLWFKRWL